MIAVFIGLALLLSFSGCVTVQRDHVNKTYYDLDVQNTRPADPTKEESYTLLVKELTIASSFDSHSFVYRMSKNEYSTDFYNEFVNYPAKIITEKVSESLYDSRLFIPALTSLKRDIQYRLSGRIIRLYGDFQDSADLKSIIEIRILLEQQSEKDGFKLISNKTYLSTESIDSRTPDHLVDGWNRGLGKIISEFIDDFNSKI